MAIITDRTVIHRQHPLLQGRSFRSPVASPLTLISVCSAASVVQRDDYAASIVLRNAFEASLRQRDFGRASSSLSPLSLNDSVKKIHARARGLLLHY